MKVTLTKHEVQSTRTLRSSHAAVNPIDVRWEISPDEREWFINTLPIALNDGENSDTHASKRRKPEFVKPETNGDGDGSGSDNSDVDRCDIGTLN